MECNRDEALRARDIAENKMETKDYAGAHKLILKAKQLFPELENVSQMLTVCSVHCSAETKLHGAEMDWYGILQVEPTADEAAIKKQYKKLALLLHPDKNKFAGAESAFKLIGEAMRILCDQAKRTVYDFKRNNAMAGARPGLPRKPAHTRTSVRKQPGFPKEPTKQTVPPYAGMNRQQQPPPPNTAATFWTICPFCTTKYQYYRTIMNKTLKCHNCDKAFLAVDADISGPPFGTGVRMNQSFYGRSDTTTQGVGFGPHRFPQQGFFGTPSYGMGFQGNVPAPMSSSKTNEVKDSETKGAQAGSQFDAVKLDELKKAASVEKQRAGIKTAKRRRKDASESSVDSSDTERSEEIKLDKQFSAEENAGVSSQYRRRSARNKKHVCYNENESDDDAVNSRSKRAKTSGASESNSKSKMGSVQDAESSDKEPDESSEEEPNGTAPKATDSKPAASIYREETKMNSEGLEANAPKENGCEVDKKVAEENSDKSDEDDEDPRPDPKFCDFEAEKEKINFSPDQVWALYDDSEHELPRFYGLIRKVLSTNFKVRFTWLEPSPTREVEEDWIDAELPVACGRFCLGKTVIRESLGMFSHLVTCERSGGKDIKIYPRKGEIWALYKHWDINWISDPGNHEKPEYEIVETLGDYSDDTGGDVIPLVKVEELVYTRSLNNGILHIPGSQAYRFSHRFPAYKLKGGEQVNIPMHSFELDPDAFPAGFFRKGSGTSKKQDQGGVIRETVSGCHAVNSTDPATRQKGSVCGLHKPKTASPIKNMKYEEKGKDGQMNDEVKCSTQVAGDANELPHKRPEQVDTSKQPVGESAKTNSNGASRPPECPPRVYTRSSLYPSKSEDSPVSDSKQPTAEKNQSPADLTAGKGKPRPMSQLSAESPGRAYTRRRLVSDAENDEAVGGSKRLPDTEFHQFQEDRSIDKFRVYQIWAAYDNTDGMPRLYARIKRLDSSAKKIYFSWLQICDDNISEDEREWLDKDLPISCGVFSGGKNSDSFGPQKFSHQVRDDASWKKGKYGIYPRKGEVWAVYIGWSNGWSKLDFGRHKCSIVEVIADYVAEKGVEVCHLVKVKGHLTVFKHARRKHEIKHLLEFSHQIPAFQLTDEVGGELNGCWELDPASVPPELFVRVKSNCETISLL
ncbi:unnamed protein product [Victoria cruziana]